MSKIENPKFSAFKKDSPAYLRIHKQFWFQRKRQKVSC